MTDRPDLRALFSPGSVAVFGASERPGSFGGRVVSNLVRAGFAGRVVPVNPSAATVFGLTCHPTLAAAGGDPVDHAVVCVPAARAPAVVTACAEAGVRAVSVLAGGFAESGGPGRELQEQITATCRCAGMTLLGPNSLGVIQPRARFVGSPSSAVADTLPVPGPIALISQSGAVAADVWSHLAGTCHGLASWVATGNEAALSATDVLHHVVADPDVRAIGLYLESVTDVDGLREAADAARARGTRIVALKAGGSVRGGAAVRSHTAALLSDDRRVDALLEALGILRVRSAEELADALRLTPMVSPRTRLVVMSSSGGSGAIAADIAESAGRPLPGLDPERRARVAALVGFGSAANPIDLTGRTNERPELLRETLAALDPDDDDHVLFVHGAGMRWRDRAVEITAILTEHAARCPAPLTVVGTMDPDVRDDLERAGIAVFTDTLPAVRAICALAGPYNGDGGLTDPHTDTPRPVPSGSMLLEPDALDLLEDVGISVPQRRRVTGRDELAAALRALPAPAAMKAVLPGVAHKTELGAVRLRISDERAGETAFAELTDLAAQHEGAEPVLVEEMVTDAVAELSVSAVSDPTLGPFVTVAAGGTWIELLDDVVIRPAPVGPAEARAMLRELRMWPLLAGYRGGPAADVDALATLIARTSSLIGATTDVREVELNPVMATPSRACAVDALVLTEPGPAERREPRTTRSRTEPT